MAARKRSAISSLALPWERQGAWSSVLITPGRVRAVIAAIALSIAAIGIWKSVETRERIRASREVIAETRRALAQFREEMGRCPHSLRELVSPARAGTRYLREEPADAWGNPLWVRCPGRYDPEGVDVVSAGPSGNFLDDDNIQ